MSTERFVPSTNELTAVIQLLHENGIAVTNSRQAYENLKQHEKNPTFCILLGCIMKSACCPVEIQLSVPWSLYRQLAGVTLKNNISTAKYALGEAAVMEAARCALECLREPSDPQLARASAQIISKVTSLTSVEWWMDSGIADLASVLLNELLPKGGLQSLASLYALQYLMEDVPRQVGHSSEHVILKVSELILSNDASIELRKAGFRMCFNTYEQSSLLDWSVESLSPLQQGLVNASWAFSKVCTSIVEGGYFGDSAFYGVVLRTCLLLLDYFEYFGDISPEMPRMQQYWVVSTMNVIADGQSARGELCAAAIDLISGILDIFERTGGDCALSFLTQPIDSSVSSLIPSLVRLSVMCDEEVASILESDDYLVRDNVAVCFDLQQGTKDITADDTLNEDDAAISIRRSALNCVDKLTTYSSSQAFEAVAKELSQLWVASEWKLREVGIVLVGTIARGCSNELDSLLPSILPQVLQFASNETEHICVGSIAVWCLSRLVENTLPNSDDPNDPKRSVVDSIICTIMERLQCRSRRIQHACVSALNHTFVLLDSCGKMEVMIRNFPRLYQCIFACLPVYTTRTLSLLVDLLGKVVRQSRNSPEVMQFGHLLKEERTKRAGLFEVSYAKVFVNQTPNELVNKDIFSIDRAVISYCAQFPDSQFALVCLNNWSEVLKDMVSRDALDDNDLVFSSLLISGGFTALVGTADLEKWVASSSWSLLASVVAIFEKSQVPEIQMGAASVLSCFVQALGASAIPAELVLRVVRRAQECVTNADFPQIMATLVRLIVLIACSSMESQDVMTQAVGVACMQLRCDIFGDSLFFYGQMACDICRLLENTKFIPIIPVGVACKVLAQLENSYEKSEATTRIAKVACASTDMMRALLGDLLRLIYSWQQSAELFPETAESIRAVFICAGGNCNDLLKEELSKIPPQFCAILMETYQLS